MNDVLAKEQVVFNQVIDESAKKNNVCAGADRHPDVGQRARAREAWIDMDDRGAFITQRKPTGCASAIEEPSIKMQSAFARSCCAVVAPPRPKEVPRPGTVLLCHIRAWLDTQTMPRPPVNSFLMR
jgi:hypothetical protein